MFAHDEPVTSELAGYFINVYGKTLGVDTVSPMSVPGPPPHILKWSRKGVCRVFPDKFVSASVCVLMLSLMRLEPFGHEFC